jgi:hypothetical protein
VRDRPRLSPDRLARSRGPRQERARARRARVRRAGGHGLRERILSTRRPSARASGYPVDCLLLIGITRSASAQRSRYQRPLVPPDSGMPASASGRLDAVAGAADDPTAPQRRNSASTCRWGRAGDDAAGRPQLKSRAAVVGDAVGPSVRHAGLSTTVGAVDRGAARVRVGHARRLGTRSVSDSSLVLPCRRSSTLPPRRSGSMRAACLRAGLRSLRAEPRRGQAPRAGRPARCRVPLDATRSFDHIGRGGMADIYLAAQTSTETLGGARPWVIKEVFPALAWSAADSPLYRERGCFSGVAPRTPLPMSSRSRTRPRGRALFIAMPEYARD